MISVNISSAQDFPFSHFSMKDGLGSPTVYSCFQDNQGFLWLATDNGVNRFDGFNFEHFSVDDGLADSEISGIFQDKYDRIWFLPFNGRLSYFYKGKFYNETQTSFLKKAFCSQSFSNAVEDGSGNLWLAGQGTHVVKINDEVVRVYDFGDDASVKFGIGIFLNDKKEVEFGTGEKIYGFDYKNDRIFVINSDSGKLGSLRGKGTNHSIAFNIVPDGIVQWSDGRQKLVLQRPRNKPERFYTSLLLENNEILWIGTLDEGVLEYAVRNDTLYYSGSHLKNIQVNDIYQDHEGNLWFCTNDEGVYMNSVFSRNATVYTRTEEFLTGNLFTVFIDKKDNVWTGGERGILSKIETASRKITSYRLNGIDYTNNFRIIDITSDGSDNIWLATNNSVFRIKPTGEIVTVSTSDNTFRPPRAARSIAISESGDIFVAFASGVIRYNAATGSFEKLPNLDYPLRTFYVHTVHDRIFISNINGLCEYKNETVVPLYLNDKRLTQRVARMYNLDDSTMVIATNGFGAYVYRNGNIIQQIRTSDGLPSNECRSVYASGKNVWFATDKGLVRAEYANDSIKVRYSYNTQFGVQTNDLRDVAVKNDTIFLATSNGLFLFGSQPRQRFVQPSTVNISSFSANNVTIPTDSLIVLKYSQNNIQITYQSITFNNPQLTLYEYSSGNGKEHWIRTRSNQVNLTQLPAGDFEFRVRAKSAYGSWGPVTSVKFRIKKPFWETTTFRILIGLLLVLLGILPFIIRYRRRLREKWLALQKQAAINLERQRISYDLHDDLGSTLTSIAMNSDIVLQKRKRSMEFERELELVAKDARQASEKITDIIWTISASFDNVTSLVSYINEFVSDFESETGIECHKTLPEHFDLGEVGPNVRKSIILSVKEIFHNIKKHSGATRVDFELTDIDGILKIKIRDNGKGFDTSASGSGIGLNSIKKRMESIGGEFQIQSEKGSGTTVILFCKLGNTQNPT